MRNIISIIAIVVYLSANAQNNITHQNINGSSVISLTLENLVEMVEMPLTEWKKIMDSYYYTQEGLNNNLITYSSGTMAYVRHVGGQFFSKSIVGPLAEYTLMNKSSHYRMKDELVNFISNISPHYVETVDSWNYYMLRYNMNIYQIAMLGDSENTRIVILREENKNNQPLTPKNQEPIQMTKVTFSNSTCSYYIPVTGNAALKKTIEDDRLKMMRNIFENFVTDTPEGWTTARRNTEKRYDNERMQPISYGSEFLLNTKHYYQNSYIISISYNYSIFKGGANANYGTIIQTFDKSTGKRVELEDIIIDERNFLLLAEQQFRKEYNIPNNSNLNDHQCLYFKNNQFRLPRQFEFTPQGIHFLYDIYEVACRTAGILEFTLSYSDLNGIANYIR